MERLSNGMNRVVRFTNWHEPILEGYFPKLDSVVSNRVWPPRPANTKLRVIFFILLIVFTFLDSFNFRVDFQNHFFQF